MQAEGATPTHKRAAHTESDSDAGDDSGEGWRNLSTQQALACSLRILARTGWSQNIAGHITIADPNNEFFYINPWGLWWGELKASDICHIDIEGRVQSGLREVTPAVFLHTEIHRLDSKARVVIHNHPTFGTVHACLGQAPLIVDQTASMF